MIVLSVTLVVAFSRLLRLSEVTVSSRFAWKRLPSVADDHFVIRETGERANEILGDAGCDGGSVIGFSLHRCPAS
jgi:hypothetical protein